VSVKYCFSRDARRLGRSPAMRNGKRIIWRYLDQTDAAAMTMALNNA